MSDQKETRLQEYLRKIKIPDIATYGIVRFKDVHGKWNEVSLSRSEDRTQPDRKPILIYSITKTFISALTLILTDRHKISVDQYAQEFISNFQIKENITIRHLLNHTSGLPDYGTLGDYHDAIKFDSKSPWSEEEFFTRTIQQGWLFEPGRGWAYSNIGYLLLKKIIEKLGGADFATVLQRELASPLNLNQTYVPKTLMETSNLEAGYTTLLNRSSKVEDIRERYHPGWVAHGVIASTPENICRFFEMLESEKAGGSSLLGRMLNAVAVPGNHPPAVRASYGLGLMVDPDSPLGLCYGHGGNGPGYSVTINVLKAEKFSPIVMLVVNTDGFNSAVEASELLRLVAIQK